MISRDVSGMLALFSRLRRCAPHIAEGLGNRRALALLELQESAHRGARLLMIGGATAYLLSLAAFSVTILVAAIYWDTPHRVTAIAILLGIEVLLAIVGGVWVYVGWHRWSFFQMTREQIERDTECLNKILEDNQSQSGAKN